ncbi:1,2-phenylacetyl-CoA epoxidase subunit PaaC [Actinomadura chibensis]|uniref:Phenylacetate-CoA oxygenase subunit PaaC n=1 Tax=Actinomadura chibensis TaxID=392828 RepID=A0A5D0NUC1_9ACTN|nr:1,2-phenylacetyl-CoA epoxidase subunit PaaC [Actinomadura chibensis]TYB47832.1 phenylacetate-CoA oxygenase subunit PaaC [Actinomadura chibensis]
MTDHANAYAGLQGDDSQWAFGTDFEDPLAGVDTTLPSGVNRSDLAAYCLMLADDALVMSHRLAQWCSNAPDLEDDIALANIALDLLGQARLLLARGAAADPGVVPALPVGSPVPPEDALAFFRGATEYRCVRLVEAENGDFGRTIARLALFAAWRLEIVRRLASSRDPVLAAVAAKGIKELAYHRDYAGRWFLILARGTAESRRRVVAGLAAVWPLHAELFTAHPVERRLARAGVGVDPGAVAGEVGALLDQMFSASGVERPDARPLAGPSGRTGRDGLHTEALSRMLAEMQVVAREHPRGSW